MSEKIDKLRAEIETNQQVALQQAAAHFETTPETLIKLKSLLIPADSSQNWNSMFEALMNQSAQSTQKELIKDKGFWSQRALRLSQAITNLSASQALKIKAGKDLAANLQNAIQHKDLHSFATNFASLTGVGTSKIDTFFSSLPRSK